MGEKISFNSSEYNTDILENVLSTMIKQYKHSGKDEVVICGIGTDKAIFDSVGCLVGSILEEKHICKKIKIYGTLEYPLHALNLENRIEKIYKDHKDAFVIGVDASIGNDDKFNFKDIILRKCGVKAGKGAGKNLPEVGDISLVGIVNESNDSPFFLEYMCRSVRLFDIYSIAQVIAEIIMKFDERIGA